MPIWKPSPIQAEHVVELHHWRILETVLGELHFSGERADGDGRASSAIVQLDLEARVGTTRSGRRYLLCGRPGVSPQADYVWDAWCRINNVESYRDVTHELLDAP
ncbi:hypothetical protein GCM10027419_50820 [Pandoraea terrae]